MSNKMLIVGNWKMNPATVEEVKEISQKTRRVASELSKTEVVMCPPYVFISDCLSRGESSNSYMGAQSVSSFKEEGAHTGEVSINMLRSLGVEYVIVGHSEERASGDTDADVSKKVSATVETGLTAIVCVGEKTRDEGGTYLEILKQQIIGSLTGVLEKYAKNIVIAYEPIWAIGAIEAMKPEQICEMAIFVRKTFSDIFGQNTAMKIKVLYGGAVNAENAADIIKIGNVDGLLVGRESVKVEGFKELLKTVDLI